MTIETKLDMARMAIGAFGGLQASIMTLILMHYLSMLRKGHEGVMPAHVVLIGIANLAATAYISFDSLGRIGVDFWTWRLPLAALTAACATPAIVIMLKHVQSRDHQLSNDT